MKPYLIRLLAITSFLALSSMLAFGQGGTTASISGSVLDATGAVLSGATVVVKSTATGAEFKVITSSSGAYTVPALGAGTIPLLSKRRASKKRWWKA